MHRSKTKKSFTELVIKMGHKSLEEKLKFFGLTPPMPYKYNEVWQRKTQLYHKKLIIPKRRELGENHHVAYLKTLLNDPDLSFS